LSDAGIDTFAMVSPFYYFWLTDSTGQGRIGLELREESVMSRAVERIIKERWPGTNDAGPWRGWSIEMVDTEGGIVRTVALAELG
jgi:hypothetical protein